VRVIAATNRNPEAEVAGGRFRQDLFYRLNAVSLHLPPLRERREDILSLARHFAAQSRPVGAPPLHFTRETVQALETYDWPGNIRELENAVVRAAALCNHTVRVDDLPERIRERRAVDIALAAPVDEIVGADTPKQLTNWPTLAEVEGRYVARVLAHTGGNKQAAARLLHVDRKTLQRMIQRHKLTTRHDE
jgi:DNA-binding NtrC family response regulator